MSKSKTDSALTVLVPRDVAEAKGLTEVYRIVPDDYDEALHQALIWKSNDLIAAKRRDRNYEFFDPLVNAGQWTAALGSIIGGGYLGTLMHVTASHGAEIMLSAFVSLIAATVFNIGVLSPIGRRRAEASFATEAMAPFKRPSALHDGITDKLIAEWLEARIAEIKHRYTDDWSTLGLLNKDLTQIADGLNTDLQRLGYRADSQILNCGFPVPGTKVTASAQALADQLAKQLAEANDLLAQVTEARERVGQRIDARGRELVQPFLTMEIAKRRGGQSAGVERAVEDAKRELSTAARDIGAFLESLDVQTKLSRAETLARFRVESSALEPQAGFEYRLRLPALTEACREDAIAIIDSMADGDDAGAVARV